MRGLEVCSIATWPNIVLASLYALRLLGTGLGAHVELNSHRSKLAYRCCPSSRAYEFKLREFNMKKYNFFALFISLAGVALVSAAHALENRPPTKQIQKSEQTGIPFQKSAVKLGSKQPPLVKFSMDMLENERISLSYVGLPLAEAVTAIEKMNDTKKGEFESTADYTARKMASLAGKFLGDSSLEDTVGFVFPVLNRKGRFGGFVYSFNADTNEVALFALPIRSSLNGIGAPNLTRLNLRRSKGLDQFNLDSRIDSASTYQASNAYGAKVTVEKTKTILFGIAANQIPFLSFKREDAIYSSPVPVSRFNMENVHAAKELPSLKALFVMKITDPYVVYNFRSSEPTRDAPFDVVEYGKYLTGDVLGIIFYSGLTGEIFARVPDTFGKPERKVEMKVEEKPAGQ